MKYERFHTLILALATLLLMAAGTSCVEPMVPDEGESAGPASLTLQINAPAEGLLTKAAQDVINASDAESKLYDIRVWAFVHGGNGSDQAVGFGSTSLSTAATRGDVTLSFPNSVNGQLDKDSQVLVDLYVLANAGSVGFGTDKDNLNVTRSQLSSAVITGNDATGFGKACVQTVPSTAGAAGLPMCYCGSLDITFLKYGLTTAQIDFIKDNPQQTTKPDNFSYAQWGYAKDHWTYAHFHPTVELTRAVSKVRFLFAKTTETISDTLITIRSIQFADDVIPTKSYLFPREGATPGSQAQLPDGSGYVSDFIWGSATSPLVVNGDLLQDDSPMRLRIDSRVVSEGQTHAPYEMDPQEYEDFLNDEIGDWDKNALKTLYLRESSQSLKGSITFTVQKKDSEDAPEVRTIDFDLSGISPQGFYRNQSDLVYVYFDAGKRQMVVTTTVLDWLYSKKTVNSSASVNVDQDGKFIIDELKSTVNKTSKPYQVTISPDGSVTAEGRVVIYGPAGGMLRVTPKGEGAGSFHLEISDKRYVTTENPTGRHSFLNGNTYLESPIDQSHDRGKIYIYISAATGAATGSTMTLTFSVEAGSRIMNADSEIIDDPYVFKIQIP